MSDDKHRSGYISTVTNEYLDPNTRLLFIKANTKLFEPPFAYESVVAALVQANSTFDNEYKTLLAAELEVLSESDNFVLGVLVYIYDTVEKQDYTELER